MFKYFLTFLILASIQPVSWSGEQVNINITPAQMKRIQKHLEEKSEELKNFDLGATASSTTESSASKKCWKPEYKKEIPKVHWWQRINPIWWVGNADDPNAPEWYRPNNPFRHLMWYFRNPFHNFTFYVIGIKDLSNEPGFIRCGDHPADVFAPNGGWNYSVIKYGILRLPFVSYWDKDVKFYIGWRERGNFGIKYTSKGDGI